MNQVTHPLDRLWGARWSSALLVAVVLAPVSVFATVLLASAIEVLIGGDGIAPNSVQEVIDQGLTPLRVMSALIVAPLLENLFCLIWDRLLPKWEMRAWWARPLLIAMIAASFHALIFQDFRPFAVLPGFFVICVLVVNVRDRVVGYWASVVHHFVINSINLTIVLAGSIS